MRHNKGNFYSLTVFVRPINIPKKHIKKEGNPIFEDVMGRQCITS